MNPLPIQLCAPLTVFPMKRTANSNPKEATRRTGVNFATSRRPCRASRYITRSPTAPKITVRFRKNVLLARSPSARTRVVELAENTMTAPNASRHSVAVRSRLYSVEWVAALGASGFLAFFAGAFFFAAGAFFFAAGAFFFAAGAFFFFGAGFLPLLALLEAPPRRGGTRLRAAR